MIPTLLITLREVIEAALIVATILGILTKLHHKKGMKTVWAATMTAFGISALLVGVGSLVGLEVQEFYKHIEAPIEGTLMILSAGFITWAVFFLHKQFAHYKVALLQKVKTTIAKKEERGIFL